jgi:hypothetical protein
VVGGVQLGTWATWLGAGGPVGQQGSLLPPPPASRIGRNFDRRPSSGVKQAHSTQPPRDGDPGCRPGLPATEAEAERRTQDAGRRTLKFVKTNATCRGSNFGFWRVSVVSGWVRYIQIRPVTRWCWVSTYYYLGRNRLHIAISHCMVLTIPKFPIPKGHAVSIRGMWDPPHAATPVLFPPAASRREYRQELVV